VADIICEALPGGVGCCCGGGGGIGELRRVHRGRRAAPPRRRPLAHAAHLVLIALTHWSGAGTGAGGVAILGVVRRLKLKAKRESSSS